MRAGAGQRELPDPVPGAGELLVAVKACSVNFPDVLVIEDRYQVKPPRPFAPGTEIAGVVEAVGAGDAGGGGGVVRGQGGGGARPGRTPPWSIRSKRRPRRSRGWRRDAVGKLVVRIAD